MLSGGPSTVTKKIFKFLRGVEKNTNTRNMLWITTHCKLFGGSIKSSKKRREFGRAIIKKKTFTINQKFY